MMREKEQQSRKSCSSTSIRVSQSQFDTDDDDFSLKSSTKRQEKNSPLEGSSRYEPPPQVTSMRSNLINGFSVFAWLVHSSALAFTIAECVINVKGLYLADEPDRKTGILPGLNMKQSQDLLQFVAKLHEILILASLSSIALQVARRMLAGDGLSVGLLTGVHQFGSVSWLFSWAFLKPLISPRQARNFILAIALFLGVAYAAVVGPAAAIVLLPNLDWCDLDGVGGSNSTPEHASFIKPLSLWYGQAPPNPLDFMHPASLNKNSLGLLNCLNRGSRTPLCPTVGFENIGRVMGDLQVSGQLRPVIMPANWGQASRALVTTPEFSQYGQTFVAVASTLPEVVAQLAGVYAQYFEKMTDSEGQSPRYRYSPEQKVFAPLVQVQCTPFLSSRLSGNSSNTREQGVYHADGLRNLETWDQERTPPTYNYSWRVRPEVVEHAHANLGATKLDWFDIKDGPGSLSLGGVVTTPYWSNETGQDGPKLVKDSLIVPCVLDTRWWPVDLHYDPKLSNIVQHSLGDMAAIRGLWGAESTKEVRRTNDSIPIDVAASWAAFIDHPVLSDEAELELMGDPDLVLTKNATVSGILELLEYSVIPTDTASGEWPVFRPSFTSFGDGELDNAAGQIAVVLSLVVADALARQAVHEGLYVRDQRLANESLVMSDITILSDLLENAMPSDQEELDSFPRIDWRVERYGWAYSTAPATTRLGIAVLLLHAVILIGYLIYSLFNRRSNSEWHNRACGNLPHVITTAILSRPQHPEAVELMTTGRERDSANAQVRVRMYRHNPELIIGNAPDEGKPIEVDKQY